MVCEGCAGDGRKNRWYRGKNSRYGWCGCGKWVVMVGCYRCLPACPCLYLYSNSHLLYCTSLARFEWLLYKTKNPRLKEINSVVSYKTTSLQCSP